jgi:hypothetical protein
MDVASRIVRRLLSLALPILIPTQDSIQEFRVQTSNLGPEWGKFSGGVTNLSTKAGASSIHGEA